MAAGAAPFGFAGVEVHVELTDQIAGRRFDTVEAGVLAPDRCVVRFDLNAKQAFDDLEQRFFSGFASMPAMTVIGRHESTGARCSLKSAIWPAKLWPHSMTPSKANPLCMICTCGVFKAESTEYRVVVLPLPVGPATSSKPSGLRIIRCRPASVALRRPIMKNVDNAWQTGPWFLRAERCYLFPGDSAMGYRLPIDSQPWLPPAG